MLNQQRANLTLKEIEPRSMRAIGRVSLLSQRWPVYGSQP
jgi:hypothetical protein